MVRRRWAPRRARAQDLLLSGHVERPGNYEIVMNETTLRELVYDLGGGFRPGRDFKAAWVGRAQA